MKNLEYQIQINASPEKVWKVLFTQDDEKKLCRRGKLWDNIRSKV